LLSDEAESVEALEGQMTESIYAPNDCCIDYIGVEEPLGSGENLS
jgi:hypothetical protein